MLIRSFLADWNDAEALNAISEAPKRKPVIDEHSDELIRFFGEQIEKMAAAGPPTIGTHPLKPEISADDMKLEVGLLADDAHAGRATGSDGAKLAADWLGEYFAKSGLKPLPEQQSFFQEFEFNAGERLVRE